jgi:hypothetical protein
MNPAAKNERATRSTKVWYDDGTVILKAGSTMFRVYKGILASRSPVFQDMFLKAQPDTTSSDDECPSIELQDDPKTLELFLLILHDFRFTETHPLGFRDAVQVVLLSNKYCADVVEQWAIRYIHKPYGATKLVHYLSLAKSKERNLDGSDHVTVINIARLCNRKYLLPLAFYLAATTLTLDEIYMGVKNRSGGLTTFDDRNDAKICAEGKLRMAHTFHLSSFLLFGRLGGKGCKCYGNWASKSVERWLPVGEPKSEEDLRLDLAITIKNINAFTMTSRTFCGACVLSFMYDKQQLIWDSIPGLFGLDPWEKK